MIRPGEEWGARGEIPIGTPVASSDADLAGLVRAHPEAGAFPLVALAAGDLCRTLGGRGDVAERIGGEGAIAEVDVGRARLDDAGDVLFVAHLVARRPWWRGDFAVVMNAEFLGPLRLAPRGHPGDGRFDLTEGSLRWRERLVARKRAETGDHLPHPALRTRGVAEVQLGFDRPVSVHLDGRRHGRARRITITRDARRLRVAV